jgi:hypothetical protein
MTLELTSLVYQKQIFKRSLWIKGQPRLLDLTLTHVPAPEGTALTEAGNYNLPISVLGHKTEHPFRVIKGLNEISHIGGQFH